jgi:hypothetical protein
VLNKDIYFGKIAMQFILAIFVATVCSSPDGAHGHVDHWRMPTIPSPGQYFSAKRDEAFIHCLGVMSARMERLEFESNKKYDIRLECDDDDKTQERVMDHLIWHGWNMEQSFVNITYKSDCGPHDAFIGSADAFSEGNKPCIIAEVTLQGEPVSSYRVDEWIKSVRDEQTGTRVCPPVMPVIILHT